MGMEYILIISCFAFMQPFVFKYCCLCNELDSNTEKLSKFSYLLHPEILYFFTSDIKNRLIYQLFC